MSTSAYWELTCDGLVLLPGKVKDSHLLNTTETGDTRRLYGPLGLLRIWRLCTISSLAFHWPIKRLVPCIIIFSTRERLKYESNVKALWLRARKIYSSVNPSNYQVTLWLTYPSVEPSIYLAIHQQMHLSRSLPHIYVPGHAPQPAAPPFFHTIFPATHNFHHLSTEPSTHLLTLPLNLFFHPPI